MCILIKHSYPSISVGVTESFAPFRKGRSIFVESPWDISCISICDSCSNHDPLLFYHAFFQRLVGTREDMSGRIFVFSPLSSLALVHSCVCLRRAHFKDRRPSSIFSFFS